MNLSNSMITLKYDLYTSPNVLKMIQREPLKVRQRVWSCIISLCMDRISVAPWQDLLTSTPLASDSLDWYCLAAPNDFQIIKVRKQRLWWRTVTFLTEEASLELCLSEEVPKSSLSDLSHLEKVNPLQFWVRSPEQASLRRALLTQRAKALCISAPRGSGTTLAMASAVADWLDSCPGECIFITRSATKVNSTIDALSNHLDRVHIISPAELTQVLLNASDTPLDHGSSSLQLTALEEGSLAADSMSEQKWSKWSTWADEHSDLLGPWVHSVGALRRFILNQIVVLGAPSQNSSILSERLSHLPQNWHAGLVHLGQTLWESPLLETLRALEQLSTVDWPWPQARILVIDDCLSLPWQLIYKVLKFADDHLGASGRRWTLMLASGGEGGLSSSGVSFEELETLVSGVLGWQIHRLKLNYSERLPYQKALGLRRISEEWMKGRHFLKNSISLPSTQTQSRERQHSDAQWLEPLWHIPSWEEDDHHILIHWVKLCLATPGAYILDLTARPHLSLSLKQSDAQAIYQALLGEVIVTEEMITVLQNKIIKPSELEAIELQWLIVYRGQTTESHGKLIPEVLATIDLLDFQSILYLLSRTPTPLIWLGKLAVNIPCEVVSIADSLNRISLCSPWGGLDLFNRVQKARMAHQKEKLTEAINQWRHVTAAFTYLFGKQGHKTTTLTLSALYTALISKDLNQRDWDALKIHLDQALLISDRLMIIEHDHTLNQCRQKMLGELEHTFHQVISELSDEVEDTFNTQRFDHLVDVLECLDELTSLPVAHWYYDQVREYCWMWSERALSLSIPQAQVQSPILSLLNRASSASKEYELLLSAYQRSPEPQLLTLIAEELLSLEAPQDPLSRQRRAWAMKHLNRWIIYLLEPKSQTPAMDLRPSTIAIGFALIAAQHQAWRSSESLYELSQHRMEAKSNDSIWTQAESQSEQEIEDEHRRRHWKKEWTLAYGQRAEAEQINMIRESGDIESTVAWYDSRQRPLSDDLQALNNFKIALSKLSDHWSILKPNERAYVETMWQDMKISHKNKS